MTSKVPEGRVETSSDDGKTRNLHGKPELTTCPPIYSHSVSVKSVSERNCLNFNNGKPDAQEGRTSNPGSLMPIPVFFPHS